MVVAAVAMVAAVACTPTETVEPTSTTASTTSSSTSTVPPGTDPCASGGLAFTAEGLVATVGDAESDATRIGGIRWQPEPSCERILVEFSTGAGSPATSVGLIGVSILSGTGIVRITLPDSVDETAVADLTTDGELASRLFVVRDGDGSLFIDVVTTTGVAVGARAFVQASPALLIIDLVSAPDAPIPAGAAVSDTSVVATPLPGPALYPLTVEGYARPSIRSVRLLVISGDVVDIDRAIALSGATDAWQAVATRLDDGPSGMSTIFLGAADANGRPAEGSTVAVDLP